MAERANKVNTVIRIRSKSSPWVISIHCNRSSKKKIKSSDHSDQSAHPHQTSSPSTSHYPIPPSRHIQISSIFVVFTPLSTQIWTLFFLSLHPPPNVIHTYSFFETRFSNWNSSYKIWHAGDAQIAILYEVFQRYGNNSRRSGDGWTRHPVHG